MKSMYIRTTDVEIYCKITGTGEPLLLLHGNGEDHQIFEHQIIHFSKQFQVIAMDTRGHGHSEHGKEILTFKKIAQDILAVLNYLNLEKIMIMGFSDGGNIALYFASHYPKRINKLVVIGANYKVNGLSEKSLTEIRREYAVLNILGNYFSKAEKKKQVIDLMWHQLDLKVDDLLAIKVPTLIVAGEYDVINESHTISIHKWINGSELVIIPKASHFLMIEKYEEFNQLVESFLCDV